MPCLHTLYPVLVKAIYSSIISIEPFDSVVENAALTDILRFIRGLGIQFQVVSLQVKWIVDLHFAMARGQSGTFVDGVVALLFLVVRVLVLWTDQIVCHLFRRAWNQNSIVGCQQGFGHSLRIVRRGC